MLKCVHKRYVLTLLLLLVSSTTFASPDHWLDVRTSEEFSQGHVSSAVNIPFDTIADQITSVTTDKNAEIYLYCGSGRRAGIAEQTLRKMGYTHITNIGGIKEALKLEKAPNP